MPALRCISFFYQDLFVADERLRNRHFRPEWGDDTAIQREDLRIGNASPGANYVYG